MKIVLATPLYPPDIAPPAPYVKNLAQRLAVTDTITIVAYGRFVEPVTGVRIIAIDKRTLLPIRLVRYFLALVRATRNADVLYAENGPSVELPAAFAAFLTRIPLILHLGDQAAHERARALTIPALIEGLARRNARAVLQESPNEKPEIIPFLTRPRNQEREYELSWQHHLSLVRNAIQHA